MQASSNNLKQPTLPKECGLAIALPLTQDEAFQDVELYANERDYIPGRVHRFSNLQSCWEQIIQPVADVCSHLIPIAKDLGVDVREAATAKDVNDLFQSCSVVTLVAHWRSHFFRLDDLTGNEAALASKILNSDDPISSSIKTQLGTKQLAEPPSAKQLMIALNHLIKAPSSLKKINSHPNVKVVFDDVGLAASNREMVDEWAKGILKPGNRLELRDGLYSIKAFTSWIPPLSKGIIDFATCHSSVLGNEVRKYRPDWRVIINSREVQPVPRLLILKLLYEQLANGCYNYGRLLAHIHAELQQQK